MYAKNQKHQALALFDFDGTLYPNDSFTGFIFYVLNKPRIIARGFPILPWIAAYYLRQYPAHQMRPHLFRAMFKGLKLSTIEQITAEYAAYLIQNLDPKILSQLKQHQALGHQVVLVSATVDIYLKHVANALKVDLICSEIEVIDGEINGHYMTADCSNAYKKLRILAHYPVTQYAEIYAYGNSDEDEAMLSLAHHAFMIGRNQDLPKISVKRTSI